jgi:hypothetical protein
MSDTTDLNTSPWPRDLKIFALFSALWAAGLTARILVRDSAYYPGAPMEAVVAGIQFGGYSASLVLIAQAMTFSVFAIGIAAERKWGLVLALFYMLEIAFSNLIFMAANIWDFTQGRNVRNSGWIGIAAVLILLYLWIRSRELLFGPDS